MFKRLTASMYKDFTWQALHCSMLGTEKNRVKPMHTLTAVYSHTDKKSDIFVQ